MSNYAMIDLEMCRIPRVLQPDHIELHNEIIQIGAVLIDNSYHISDRFSTYVCPQFGTIDDFIEKLTGIGANDVKDAPSIQEALHLFYPGFQTTPPLSPGVKPINSRLNPN